MSAGAAVVTQIVNAVRAMGVVVTVEPTEFLKIVARLREPLVVVSETTFFTTRLHYLVSYKGLAFYTKSSEELRLPPGTEIVQAKSITIPG